VNVVAAIRLHRLEFGHVLPRTVFRAVRQDTHSYADAIQAALWAMGVALETRNCPEA